MLRHIICAATLIIVTSTVAVPDNGIRTQRIQFDPGAESATIEGMITGAEIVDYVVNAREGQAANISLGSQRPTPYFNLLPPGSTGEAVFVGSRQGNQFEGVLDRSGDWTVRVYQMGNARDAGETHRYRLEVIIAAGGAMASETNGGTGIEVMIADCSRAARDFHRSWGAGVDLRYSEPRVDGTETVGGEIYLETRSAYVACAFAPGGAPMVEFFVDGTDHTAFVTSGPDGLNQSAAATDWAYVAPEEGGPRRWQVTARGGLRMHETRSTGSPVTETLSEGAILSNLGCQSAGGRTWCDVQPFRGGTRGFVAAEFLVPAPGPQGTAPPVGEDNSALRAGQGDFDARAPYTACAREGMPMREDCEAAVARGTGGDATVVITFPDGFQRILFFTHGEFMSADASEAGGGFDTDWSKDADGTYRIRVDGEHYEVPGSIIFGG